MDCCVFFFHIAIVNDFQKSPPFSSHLETETALPYSLPAFFSIPFQTLPFSLCRHNVWTWYKETEELQQLGW